MKTTSIWENTADSFRHYPELTSHITADVVIVGGGITGLTAALLLADGGKKVVLLEAMKIGLGTTGNSTGNLYSTVDEHLSVIRRKWSADVMKSVVQSRRTAIDLIESTINRFAIDCNFTRTSFNFFAEHLDKEKEDFIREEFEALEEAGLDPKISENPGMPFHVEKALSVDNQAQFHPLKYVRQLAEKISDRCAIYEDSMMVDFDEDEGLVKTEKGSVQATTVIMATHTPKGNYMVQGFLGPYREFGVAAELKSGDFPTGIFWGLDVPKHSVRVFDDGGKKYIVVIGDKYKTGQGDDTHEYVKRLERYLKERFDISEQKMVWGGQQYRPADGLPYIGKHSDRLWFMTGFATDGLVYGTLAAMIAGDDILGRPNMWADVYRLKRFTPIKKTKEFFREQIDNLAQYLKDTPWSADEKSFSEIPRGEGRVVLKDGQKLAAYKDAHGQLEVVSAVCTHMKCIVNWNPAEKTWDCPCHGSRFKTSGEVIEGPAISALPAKKQTNDSK